MIAQLKGTISDIRGTHVVIDVGGVGYLVAMRRVADFKIGDTVSLHTHLAVRENAFDLYGFLLLDELSLFEELIKIPKIGPKSAMQILSQADVQTLMRAIGEQDPTYLTKMSGIGKKTAEKIVSELADIFPNAGVGDHPVRPRNADADVIDALIALGYSQKDAREALEKIPRDITDVNERIKLALKHVH